MRGGASKAAEADSTHRVEHGVPPVHAAWARTSEVCVLFTSPCATQSAARVARDLARALEVPLTFIIFKCASQGGQTTPAPDQDEEVQALVKELRAEGDAVTTRLYACHSVRQAIPFAFSPRSLVVVGGRHSWLPTQTERLRRALERAHHFVIVVDEPGRERLEPANRSTITTRRRTGSDHFRRGDSGEEDCGLTQVHDCRAHTDGHRR